MKITVLSEMKVEIENLLSNKLKNKFNIQVSFWNGIESEYLKIMISPISLNNTKCCQAVSFSLSDSLILQPQCYGGIGGIHIDRKPNLEDKFEKYLYCKSVKIPFRKPNPNKDSILKCIDKFIDTYLDTLKINRNNLMYQDIIDYAACLD